MKDYLVTMEENKKYHVRVFVKCRDNYTIEAKDENSAYEEAQELMWDDLGCMDIEDYDIDIEEIRKEND